MGEKKIIVEQNGAQQEVSKEKLEQMQTNPDFKIEKKEETSEKDTYKVQQRLYD